MSGCATAILSAIPLIGRQRDDYRLLVTIERRSRYVRLSKTRNRAWATANAARLLLADVELLSLSCDRGAEFARLPALFRTSSSSPTLPRR